MGGDAEQLLWCIRLLHRPEHVAVAPAGTWFGDPRVTRRRRLLQRRTRRPRTLRYLAVRRPRISERQHKRGRRDREIACG